ncbi:MAG: ABC transporter permease [Ignavibacteriaceae bacterium]
MFKNYIKIALRNIRKQKAYSFINIMGLSIGIACVVLIFLWVQYELSFDKFHKNADRLYRVGFTTEKKDFYGFFQPGPLAKYLKENFPEVEQSTNYSEMKIKVSYETKGFFCSGSFVDSAFFKMFSFPLENGNADNVLSSPNSIVISKSLSNKLFGSENPIGKTLKLNDGLYLNISGIFSDVPKTSHIQFDFVISNLAAPEAMNLWDRKSVETYVLLKQNTSLKNIDKKISGVMDVHNPSWKNILFLFPVTKSHLYEPDGTGSIIYVYIFSFFGILILIAACINFMNLSTARSEKRMKEIGIKKTIGSSRSELIKQFLTESLLLSSISLLLAIVLVELFIPYLNSSLGINISMDYSINMIVILSVITLLTGIIAGSYPAIYLSSFNPLVVLSSRVTSNGESRSSMFRKILVIAQFSFSIFIITCVLFISRQLDFLQSKPLGFNKEGVLLINTSGALRQNVGALKEELLKYPFVKSASVSATNLTSFMGAGTGPIDWAGKNPDYILEVGFNFVDEDFAETFQIKMNEGRFFSEEFSTDMSEAFVINEAAVKAMNIKDPLNKTITTWFGLKGKIIGVTDNFNTESLRRELTPVVLIPTREANYLCLRISSADIANSISLIENKVKDIVPDDPFDSSFLDKEIESLYKTERMTGNLSTFIAILAIFISCLGLFGLASFSSERRTKEIGIRKVLGASIPSVLILLTKDFARWVLIANIIAWPLAWYAVDMWLQNFAYRIEMDWAVFALSGFAALIIALITVSFQAMKAAAANPVKSLKYE